MGTVSDRMQRLLEGAAGFRIDRYPLSRAERDALQAALTARGVVAPDGYERYTFIAPDGSMRPATEKERSELLCLPDYWRKYMQSEG